MIRDFLRNAGVMGAAELVARIKGVIVLPLLTRHFGTLDFGVWSQVGMVIFTLSPLVVLGTESGLIRLLPGHPVERQYRLFQGWVLFLLANATIAALAVTLGGSWLSVAFFGQAGEYEMFMPLAAASLFATTLANAARTWFRIRNDGSTLAVATVAQASLGIVAIVAAVISGFGIYGIVVVSLAVDLVLGLGLFTFILARQPRQAPDFSIIAPSLRFGLPLLPAAYAMWGLNWMDRLFLVRYATLHDIGIYAAAYGLGYTVIQVFANPVWAMYPNLAAELRNKQDLAGVDRLLHVTAGTMLALSLPAIAGMWALEAPIISVVAGPQYLQGALVMPVIGLAYLALMLASFGDIAVGLAHRQFLSTISIALGVGVNFALNLLLIPPYGIQGAAWATLGAFVVQLAASTVFAARVGPFWREFHLPFRIVVASIVMAALVRVLDGAITSSEPIRLALLIPLGAGSYVVVLVLLRAVPSSTVAVAQQWIMAHRRVRTR